MVPINPRAKTSRSKGMKGNSSWSKVLLSVLGFIILVGASVIVAQLIIGYFMIWILGADTFNEPVPTAIYSALSYILALIFIIFSPILMAKFRRKKGEGQIMNKRELGLSGWPTWMDIGLSVAGFIIYLIFAAILTAFFNIFPWFNVSEAQDVGFSVYISGVDRLVAFITLVIIAPVAEEIIFRGWLYTSLRKKFSEKTTEKVAIVLTTILVSLLFGLVHMQWNVGVNVFAMSVVLCALREVTGTIYAGILTHMIKNGVAFYLLFVLGIG